MRTRVGPPHTVGSVAPETESSVSRAPSGGVAAFFDVDNTIIRGASAFHLGRGLYRRKFFSLWDLITFGVHQARYLIFGEIIKQFAEVRLRAMSNDACLSIVLVEAIDA